MLISWTGAKPITGLKFAHNRHYKFGKVFSGQLNPRPSKFETEPILYVFYIFYNPWNVVQPNKGYPCRASAQAVAIATGHFSLQAIPAKYN